MTQCVFHGDIAPNDLATVLVGEFNRNDLRAQAVGDDDKIVVQISMSSQRASGGATALSVTLQKHEDGVLVVRATRSGWGWWLHLISSRLSINFQDFTKIGNLTILC